MHKQFENLLLHHADVGDYRLLNWDYRSLCRKTTFSLMLIALYDTALQRYKIFYYILYMTHLRSAGSQHSQQLVDFRSFSRVTPRIFNIGRTCFTAYSVLGKPMTFLIICILAKSRKPQIFSLRLLKARFKSRKNRAAKYGTRRYILPER